MKKILLIAACIASLAVFLIYVSGNASRLTYGFASYYTFSKIAVEEPNFNRSYDTLYFNSKIHEYGMAGINDQPNNLPTSAAIFVPLVKLAPDRAKAVWIFFSVLCFFVSLFLMFKIFDVKLSESTGYILAVILFLFLPVYHGLYLGQIYVFLLFLFTLSLYGLKKDNILLLSIPLALMLIFKGYGIFPLISLAVMRKWKAAAAVIVFSVLFVLLLIPLTGINSWGAYVQGVLLNTVNSNYAAVTAYQTLNGFTKNVFSFFPSAVSSIIFIFAGILITVMVMRKIPAGNFSLLILYSASACLNVILAPLAEDYHYALCIPLVFSIGVVFINQYRSFKPGTVLFFAAVVLLSLPYNYKSMQGYLTLLAYPRLYAGIILLFLSLKVRNAYPVKG